jgi:hypothetical protein
MLWISNMLGYGGNDELVTFCLHFRVRFILFRFEVCNYRHTCAYQVNNMSHQTDNMAFMLYYTMLLYTMYMG